MPPKRQTRWQLTSPQQFRQGARLHADDSQNGWRPLGTLLDMPAHFEPVRQQRHDPAVGRVGIDRIGTDEDPV